MAKKSTTGSDFFDDLLSTVQKTVEETVQEVLDPWTSLPVPVPYQMFGRGSRHPFPWYFEGPSTVEVTSIHDVEAWLLGCEYVSDQQLFGEADHWMHPGEFEKIRMGDCDDHSLWAWRKLAGLGMPTSLYLGNWMDDEEGHHTWLVTEVDGVEHIFESTSKVFGEALKPLAGLKDQYRPYLSVDDRFRTRAFVGGPRDIIGGVF